MRDGGGSRRAPGCGPLLDQTRLIGQSERLLAGAPSASSAEEGQKLGPLFGSRDRVRCRGVTTSPCLPFDRGQAGTGNHDLELTRRWLGMSRQCVDYEQARRLAGVVAPAVCRGGREPKRLPSRDPHLGGAVLELVSNLALKHVARVRAVAPLGPAGSGRVLDKRPADTVDDLLDITHVQVVLGWGSVEGDHARRWRIRAH